MPETSAQSQSHTIVRLQLHGGFLGGLASSSSFQAAPDYTSSAQKVARGPVRNGPQDP